MSVKTPTLRGAVQAPLPSVFAPMLLHSEKKLVQRDGWLYQPKLDGMRCIAIVGDSKSKLLSRNGRDITACFPSLAEALAVQRKPMVLDAEIIVVGAMRTNRQGLQAAGFTTENQGQA